MKQTRRIFIKKTGQVVAGLGLVSGIPLISSCGSPSANVDQELEKGAEKEVEKASTGELFFKISLAQWSLNKSLFAGEMDNLDFAAKAKNDFGIEAVEYVNQFFKDKAEDQTYLAEMKKRAADNGVKSLLIMIDGEGGLGDTDDAKRKQAVENHYKWVEAAKFLGCHSIRVNAYGEGTAADVAKAAVDGLGSLAEFAAKSGMNVIVENHGGYSSNGMWLTNVMNEIHRTNCGTLPDFGNFCLKQTQEENWQDRKCLDEYDRYKGVREMMPLAKAVSAKTHDFDENGNETHTDYKKMMQIVKDAGYTGYVGVEYEGREMPAEDGIRATKALLERVGKELS
ncbi:MAG: sugar phosphate isomerase/epimerase family protein [Chitinophagales bacterium]